MGRGTGEWAWAGAATDHSMPFPPGTWAGFHTFEAISTQALELVLASRQAGGTILARLALTWGAVVALPNALAAQKAVGKVQPLAIH